MIAAHFDAGLVVPTMLWLRGSGRLGADGPTLPANEAGNGMGRLLTALGWIGAPDSDGSKAWTVTGLEARAFSEYLGLVGSYLPLLSRLAELYAGTLTLAASGQQPGAAEWHVHRKLNIDASAHAHRRYFTDAADIFIELFDREPVASQPRFVADMGCGDGTWLIDLHRTVAERTRRGACLDTDPLLMVGIDPSPEALEQARAALADAGVPALLILGDVRNPDQLSNDLAQHGLAIEDGLHIRSFCDHDRAYVALDAAAEGPGWASGAYLDRDGEPVAGADAERDLIAHLERWVPYVRKHGLVVIEAHCVAPEIARRHVGTLHSVAFDAYHSYSHQYPIEHAAFLRCCHVAGLAPVSHSERRYPGTRPFVAVSVNRMLGAQTGTDLPALGEETPRADTWRPDPGTDLADGRGLHELLFEGGDLHRPRLWCAAPTGKVVAGALDLIEARIASAGTGETIRVLDYGTGSGLAAIELLKALHERDVATRLDSAGVSLELHLADLPSSWFARGYELLSGCAWTRFHSLRSADGAFRPLRDVTGGQAMDVVMANMVFHLIPAAALGQVAAELASVVAPGGRLLWSSPDLGPPEAYTVLFHDPNRELRKRWLERLRRKALPPAVLREAQGRADKRILPEARRADDVAEALGRHFDGAITRPSFEILAEEVLLALLVPSNQREYLPEVDDPRQREEMIRTLMLDEVLPAMQAGPAGTSLGLNLQWTLGSFAA